MTGESDLQAIRVRVSKHNEKETPPSTSRSPQDDGKEPEVRVRGKGISSRDSRYGSIVSEGTQLYRRGIYDRAIQSFTKALALKPKSTSVLVLRGQCYLANGDASAALDDALYILELAPNFYKGLYLKAEALFAAGNFEFALVNFHKGARLRPDLSQFHLGIKKTQEAIEGCFYAARKGLTRKLSELSTRRVFTSQVALLVESEWNPALSSKRRAPVSIYCPQWAQPSSSNSKNQEKPTEAAPTKPNSTDHLLGALSEDKRFLQSLRDDSALGFQEDVKDGLRFLHSRETYWEQLATKEALHREPEPGGGNNNCGAGGVSSPSPTPRARKHKQRRSSSAATTTTTTPSAASLAASDGSARAAAAAPTATSFSQFLQLAHTSASAALEQPLVPARTTSSLSDLLLSQSPYPISLPASPALAAATSSTPQGDRPRGGRRVRPQSAVAPPSSFSPRPTPVPPGGRPRARPKSAAVSRTLVVKSPAESPYSHRQRPARPGSLGSPVHAFSSGGDESSGPSRNASPIRAHQFVHTYRPGSAALPPRPMSSRVYRPVAPRRARPASAHAPQLTRQPAGS